MRERIIVPLDRQFVIYPGGACVDKGAGVDESAGVDEGARVDEGEECPGVVYPGSCDVLVEKLKKDIIQEVPLLHRCQCSSLSRRQ